jgi:hypothetical protein
MPTLRGFVRAARLAASVAVACLWLEASFGARDACA